MNKPAAQRLSSRATGKAAGKEWFRRTVLVLCAVLMGLFSLEFGLRAANGGWLYVYPNFVLGARTVLAEGDQGRYAHDAELGHGRSSASDRAH